MNKAIRNLTSFQMITMGFFTVIMLGALLLTLPAATGDGKGASFLHALFTATSATCVTGLVVQNTATYWTGFGQFVILMLIQIGGMGVVTLAVAITIVSGKKIGLMQRSTMQEAISAPQLGGIVRLTGFIVRGILLVELLGALVMLPVLIGDYGWKTGIWYAVFHSVSAFCNAGFDLFGTGQSYISLVEYGGNPVIIITIAALIIIGGIGFMTWDDMRTHRFKLQKYRLQSKVILITTALLLLLPALFLYFYEFSQPKWDAFTRQEKLLGAIFQSVTPRTAGFNSVDLTMLSEAGQMLLLVLMLIGGAPGSTAGGMKVTTLAVLVMTAIAVFRRRENAQGFGRRISSDTVRNAATISLLYITLCFLGAFLISCIEKLPMVTCLFEAASAIGTVGLTLGITPGLSEESLLILILLMFVGRVGGLTLVFTALSKRSVEVSKLPRERITVG